MIPSEILPSCLWKDEVLHLPRGVNDAYEAKLIELGLYQEALVRRGTHGNHGGITLEETHAHFVTMFANSVSRVQCVLLDPQKKFADIPRDLLITLSSHRISILDVPCGAGASTISCLETLKELRHAGILPATPLSVSILAADISEHAMEIYRDQIDRLAPGLAACGIRASLVTRVWNAADVQQTNEMIDDLLEAGESHNEILVLLTNFSGASKTQYDKFADSFRQIWIRLSSKAARNSTILWVEPDGGEAVSLFKKISNLLAAYVWFLRTPGPRDNFLRCEYRWFARLANKPVTSGTIIHNYMRDR